MFYREGMQKIFDDLISISVLLTIIPYFYSALYLIELTPKSHKGYIQLLITLIGVLFCFTAFLGVQLNTLVGTTIIALLVIVFYANKERGQETSEGENL